MHYLEKLERDVQKGKISKKVSLVLHNFYLSYCSALMDNDRDLSFVEPLLLRFLEMVEKQLKKPHAFKLYHEKVEDYYQFGLDMIRPLVEFEKSNAFGLEHVDQMVEQIAKGENVVLFANHQIEPDPQAINLLLEKTHPDFAKEMVFVAGHRVITDPLAVPFSKGCNLLCIYSKKYVETPPEEKHDKLMHNQKTLKKMGALLKEGGHCIYVAPSGGRDRPNKRGKIDVASFDPQSIELFYLLARQSKRPTHFYPLALLTYNLLPPPNTAEVELSEWRHPQCTPIHLSFGAEIDMENICKEKDKSILRKMRTKKIWELVKKEYKRIQ